LPAFRPAQQGLRGDKPTRTSDAPRRAGLTPEAVTSLLAASRSHLACRGSHGAQRRCRPAPSISRTPAARTSAPRLSPSTSMAHSGPRIPLPPTFALSLSREPGGPARAAVRLLPVVHLATIRAGRCAPAPASEEQSLIRRAASTCSSEAPVRLTATRTVGRASVALGGSRPPVHHRGRWRPRDRVTSETP
jgi:hypothetical protein